MEKNSLESLKREIKDGEIKALESLVKRKEVEQYFVDFKTTQCKDYTSQNRLTDNDKKNLAKAISGFGNSEGGLLIWGIDTEGNGDFANSLKPIISPETFLSLINSNISRLTVPAHNTVEGFVIKDKDDPTKGYVITVIPKFEGLPIQVIDGYQFFMRAGDSFIPIPHAILSGMFGRRPNPNMSIEIIPGEEPTKENNFVVFSIIIQLINKGKGIARDIFVNCSFSGPGNSSEIYYQAYNKNNFTYQALEGRSIYEWDFISKPNFRVAPEQIVQIEFLFKLKPPFQEDLIFQFIVGADSQVPNRLEIIRSKEELDNMYNRFINDNEFEFIQELLKEK